MFFLTQTEANCIKQACEFWMSAAERKYNRIREMQVHAEETHRELTTSEQADVEYVNGMLPARIDATRAVLAKIKANAAEKTAYPIEII